MSLDFPPPVKWKITAAAGYGDNAYTIKTNDGSKGWVVASDSDYDPIAVQPLTGGSDNEVFHLVRIDRD